MPLAKRILHNVGSYVPAEIIGPESNPGTILGDVNMARTIGVVRQINNLAMYAAEVFDNLTKLGEDTHFRIRDVTMRSKVVLKQLSAVETKVRHSEVALGAEDVASKRVAKKGAYIPTVLTRKTNCPQIQAQYSICILPPQLWKIESIVPDDCMINFSNPGFNYS